MVADGRLLALIYEDERSGLDPTFPACGGGDCNKAAREAFARRHESFDRISGLSLTIKERSYRRRSFVADTSALILFFTTTGIINERFVAGMSWEQVLNARLLGALLMIPVGRPYGLWRDWLMARAGETRLSRLFWDSMALMSFQVPIYAAIIALSGASGRGLIFGILGAAVMMLALGRPYGAFLNLVRRLFGLPPGGDRPMSLDS